MLANCRHFATLLTALLRHGGVPARARCGFASYFEQGKYVDHWVCEYWSGAEQRWASADAQIDDLQRKIARIDFDTTDMPAERFWTGGAAWLLCRSGAADAERFGIADMWGLWYVRSNLKLDLASLNKVELLPWDFWGKKLDELSDHECALLDRVARLAASADSADWTELRAISTGDAELRVPEALMERVRAGDAGAGTGANPLAEKSL